MEAEPPQPARAIRPRAGHRQRERTHTLRPQHGTGAARHGRQPQAPHVTARTPCHQPLRPRGRRRVACSAAARWGSPPPCPRARVWACHLGRLQPPRLRPRPAPLALLLHGHPGAGGRAVIAAGGAVGRQTFRIAAPSARLLARDPPTTQPQAALTLHCVIFITPSAAAGAGQHRTACEWGFPGQH